MRTLIALAACVVLLASGCAEGGASRTVLVDYSHDEFPSFVASNFPKQVQVHPGTELVFEQTWTGEPHSVTGGTLVNELLEAVRPYMEKLERGEEIPEEPPKDVMKLEERVAWSVSHDEGEFGFIQTGAQPCYLARGEPRKDGKPCEEQTQPIFTGTQSFYNSGIIPYEGPSGNEFSVQLAEDIAPGSYWFFCNFHGEFQSTEVVVKPPSEKIPSAEEVSRAALEQVRDETGGFDEIVRDARDDGKVTLPPAGDGDPVTVEGNFAGLFDPKFDHWHSINEFIPNTLRARAGEDITWNLIGLHTISFGVPKYFPVMTFDENGTVRRNKRLDPPAGGAREFDVPEDERYDDSRTEPVRFDAGEWDGRGFWSSGTIDAHPYIEYTMRITEPGTYRFACLIHPPMVGTVEVT